MNSVILESTLPSWYWSEPTLGYSIEDCEQIVAQELNSMNNSK